MRTLISTVRAWLTQLRERLIDRPLRRGHVIAGRYEILDVLGMGSYGISYLCADAEQGGRQVVLKQVKPSRRHGSKGQPIYDYETSILAKLDHPAIPKLLGKFEDEGQLFFAMEYMKGRNLEDVIFEMEARYTELEALLLMAELLGIVEYLHERGIVHRDVRIPNVILVEGRLRLIDFGLARYLGDQPTQVAEALTDYQIEKQIKRAVEFPSDFYAMGHFLLFLLYTTYEAEDEVERSWEEELTLSPPTHAMLRKMLQLDPPYQTAKEMRAALEEAITYWQMGTK